MGDPGHAHAPRTRCPLAFARARRARPRGGRLLLPRDRHARAHALVRARGRSRRRASSLRPALPRRTRYRRRVRTRRRRRARARPRRRRRSAFDGGRGVRARPQHRVPAGHRSGVRGHRGHRSRSPALLPRRTARARLHRLGGARPARRRAGGPRVPAPFQARPAGIRGQARRALRLPPRAPRGPARRAHSGGRSGRALRDATRGARRGCRGTRVAAFRGRHSRGARLGLRGRAGDRRPPPRRGEGAHAHACPRVSALRRQEDAADAVRPRRPRCRVRCRVAHARVHGASTLRVLPPSRTAVAGRGGATWRKRCCAAERDAMPRCILDA